MNILLHLSPAQEENVQDLAVRLDISPFEVVHRLLELGYPILRRQTRLKPQKAGKLLKLVRS
jgi:hypothetical protein